MLLSTMKPRGYIPSNAEDLFNDICTMYVIADGRSDDSISDADARAYKDLCQQFAKILVNVANIYEIGGYVPQSGSGEPEPK